jgi:TATA-box binding protein (TBP) (component of TFIID and TFIIIB)
MAASSTGKMRAEITVSNVVITVILGGNVNLKLFGSLPNTNARLGQFPALQIHFKDGKDRTSTVLIFRTSKMTVPGNESEEAALLCCHRVRLFLERLATGNYSTFGWPHCGPLSREQGRFFEFRKYRVVNVVTTVSAERGINLDSLDSASNGFSNYQPDIFSAVRVKLEDENIYGSCVNYFDTGRFTVMGAHNFKHAVRTAKVSLRKIYRHLRDDVQPNANARYISRMRRFGDIDSVNTGGARPVNTESDQMTEMATRCGMRVNDFIKKFARDLSDAM